MVALNWQTDGAHMQVHAGKFRTNGACGFVLKPQYMRDPEAAFCPHLAHGIADKQEHMLCVCVCVCLCACGRCVHSLCDCFCSSSSSPNVLTCDLLLCVHMCAWVCVYTASHLPGNQPEYLELRVISAQYLPRSKVRTQSSVLLQAHKCTSSLLHFFTPLLKWPCDNILVELCCPFVLSGLSFAVNGWAIADHQAVCDCRDCRSSK